MAVTVRLEQMRKLEWLQVPPIITPPDHQHDLPDTFDSERRVVEAWSKACPTLSIVNLLGHRLWIEEDGEWEGERSNLRF